MSVLNDATVEYCKTRKQFGQPISSFQLIQAMIADSQSDILAAKGLILNAALKRDKNENITLEKI